MASDPGGASGPSAQGTGDQEQDPTRLTLLERRKRHGSALVDATESSERRFVMSIKIDNVDEAVIQHNLFKLHKEFLSKVFEAAPNLVFHPTSRSPDKTSKLLTSLLHFPDSDSDHRAFFHRQVTHSPDGASSTIRIHHQVLDTTKLPSVKKSLIGYLKARKIFLTGDIFDSTTLWSIGMLHSCHPQMVNRPELEEQINDLIASHPDLPAHRAKLCKLEPDAELPRVYVHARLIHWGSGANRVSTNAICLVCPKPVGLLMKTLMVTTDPSLLPYHFIPAGMAQMTSPELYRNLLIKNNDFQNSVQGIPVTSLARTCMDLEYNSPDGDMPVRLWFLQHSGIIGVEPTASTDTDGRWLFIVLKSEYDSAREFIRQFCDTIFPSLLTPDQQTRYVQSQGQMPHIYVSSPFGCDIQARAEAICQQLLGDLSTKTPPPKTSAWTAPPQFVFDDDEAYPPLSKTTKAATSDNDTATQVTQPPAKSVARTVVSTDVDTVVSRLESIVSSQFTQIQTLVTKQTDGMQAMFDRIIKDNQDANRALLERSETRQQELLDRSDARNQENMKMLIEAIRANTPNPPAQYHQPSPHHYYLPAGATYPQESLPQWHMIPYPGYPGSSAPPPQQHSSPPPSQISTQHPPATQLPTCPPSPTPGSSSEKRAHEHITETPQKSERDDMNDDDDEEVMSDDDTSRRRLDYEAMQQEQMSASALTNATT